MIGRVYRGGKVGGLLRYLYGPGRHNEHENPHLVAAWDLTTPAELATLEPRVLAGSGARAMRDFAPMTGSLELATAFRPLTDKAAAKVVWHCPLRTAPGDRRLSDAEWAEVARDVMHRTGIAQRGDDGACRWVAVRHDDVSVHLVAVLARQDGEAVRIGNDYRHLREACRVAEQRLGLTRTAPADLTADRHTTRAEVEKAGRHGLPPDRDWLREQVKVAALVTTDAQAFLGRLRRVGLAVRERTDQDGALTGYAVGRPARPGGKEVLFGGGKLAPDLSLPQLQVRWQTTRAALAEHGPPAAQPKYTGAAAELAAALAADKEPGRRLTAAARACQQATDLLREAIGNAAQRDSDATADLVKTSGQVFRAVGLLLDPATAAPLRQAGRDMDRAARTGRGATTSPTPAAQKLRSTTHWLLKAEPALLRAMGADPQLVLLLRQLQALGQTVRDLRLAQHRLAQARFAERAAARLDSVVVPRPASEARTAQTLSTRLPARTPPAPVSAARGAHRR